MMRRLVLGDGALGRTLIDHAMSEPGELYVVTADSGWVTTLRDDSIAAVEGDPTDSTHYPSTVDIVVVAADDPTLSGEMADLEEFLVREDRVLPSEEVVRCVHRIDTGFPVKCVPLRP